MAGILKIGVAGAMGRMGQAVIDVVRHHDDLGLEAVFDRAESEGETVSGLQLGPRLAAIERCDVVIDFSTAAASADLAAIASAAGSPALVIGATGFTQEEDAAIQRASQRLPIVRSGNFSIGVNVLAGLVEQAARRLPPNDWDVEIFEAHHNRKRDAPSGTALLLARAAASARGVALASVAKPMWDSENSPRRAGDIGFSVMRGGGIIGEHSVVFAAEDEIITLSHSARDRRLFARGAIAAARWVHDRPAGLFDMADVLGFRE